MFEIVALMLLSQQPMAPVAEGIASYYSVESSGDVTASGDTMRDDAMTCAMLDGEFGTHYLVVAENGNAVVVRLNDRGPYIKGRVIDLTPAAIRKLHPTDGLLKVKVFQLGQAPPPMPSKVR
ncbi:MAG: hypothetical protein GY851_34530 [bacterium]|nr:hypothetical protein [bacterium]